MDYYSWTHQGLSQLISVVIMLSYLHHTKEYPIFLWTTFDKVLTIRKYDLSDEIKWKLFQAVDMLVPLYGCTTYTLMKRLEIKLGGTK